MKTLIVVAGRPGVGKSTIGEELATRLNAVCIDMDYITQDLMINTTQKFKDLDLSTIRELQYNPFISVIKDQLNKGKIVVAIAPFTKELSEPSWINNTFGVNTSAHLVLIELSNVELELDRLAKRGAERDKIFLSNKELHRLKWKPSSVVYEENTYSSIIRFNNDKNTSKDKLNTLVNKVSDNIFNDNNF